MLSVIAWRIRSRMAVARTGKDFPYLCLELPRNALASRMSSERVQAVSPIWQRLHGGNPWAQVLRFSGWRYLREEVMT